MIWGFTCSMRRMAEAYVNPWALLGGDCKDDGTLHFAFYVAQGENKTFLYITMGRWLITFTNSAWP